jgi:hypothetical protein
MRGLTEIEWDVLDSAAAPDPCDEEYDCEPYSDDEEAAQTWLVRRGLIVPTTCVADPEVEHPALTAAGRILWALGRSVVVGAGRHT